VEVALIYWVDTYERKEKMEVLSNSITKTTILILIIRKGRKNFENIESKP